MRAGCQARWLQLRSFSAWDVIALRTSWTQSQEHKPAKSPAGEACWQRHHLTAAGDTAQPEPATCALFSLIGAYAAVQQQGMQAAPFPQSGRRQFPPQPAIHSWLSLKLQHMLLRVMCCSNEPCAPTIPTLQQAEVQYLYASMRSQASSLAD